MGIAIEKSCLVTRGKVVSRHVRPWTQIFPAYTAKKKTYFFESLHGSTQSWLGLSDDSTKSSFVWSYETPLDFHYWAEGQPNNLHNQDCVHTLGFLNEFTWNDVNCTDCPGFTCKKGWC